MSMNVGSRKIPIRRAFMNTYACMPSERYIHPKKEKNKYQQFRQRAMISQFLILLLEIPKVTVAQLDASILAKPGCNYTCGNVLIPFPFGIGAKCSFDHWFELECRPFPNSNGSITKPFLPKFNIEVLEVNLDANSSNFKVMTPPLNACSTDSHQQLYGIDLRGSPYYYSTVDNVFIMHGCPGSGVLVNQSHKIMAGCGTVCYSNNNEIPTSNCYGVHCCQTPVLSERHSSFSSLQFYQIEFNLQVPAEHQNCLVSTFIESDFVDQYVEKLSSSNLHTGFPVVLLWSLMSEFQSDNPLVSCFHSVGNGSVCECKAGYYGNPYLPDGCQVPQECKDCRGYCFGDWNITGHLSSPSAYYCEKKPLLKIAAILGLSICFGMVFSVIVVDRLYRLIRKRREMKRRAVFFKHNGGLLLQQQLSSNDGVVERTRIFSINELEKATDHFNENRILGQGGQGTVYKGMLTDGRIVAIKKAKLLDESQLVQFINEVVILSQINHRNVVKLLGCCLETEVPLLVYEFIPNGTLSEHIHDPDEDFVISWETCLKIASDSATAVAYLHSFSSIPIYHRDIKSSNILLDEKYRAKVSDFGSSRTIAVDQTHMTTIVQGTMGYLDPEYFQSYQFTEKSDVYSFGVVLLEILTGKKPMYRDEDNMEQKNLVAEFSLLSENSRLSDILDPKILREAKDDELVAVVELTKRCISLSGKLRPTMKDVAMTLEMIMKFPAQVSRWYREQQPFPISDGAFDEYSMTDISDTEFTSNTVLAAASNPPYTDMHPLLSEAK